MTRAVTCFPATEKVLLRWREVDANAGFDLWVQDLSDDERRNAARFKFNEDRGSYIAAHGLARDSLSELMPSIAPAEWKFSSRGDGKPEIAYPPSDHIHFSISHTRGFAVCAVAHAPVGTDVEAIACDPDMPLLVSRFFAPGERKLLAEVPASEKQRTFIRLWTLKEAYLKATGDGLRLPLDRAAFRFCPEPKLVLDGSFHAGEGWQCAELSPYPGFQVAVACRCANMMIEAKRSDRPCTETGHEQGNRESPPAGARGRIQIPRMPQGG